MNGGKSGTCKIYLSQGKWKYVANFDGTINNEKTKPTKKQRPMDQKKIKSTQNEKLIHCCWAIQSSIENKYCPISYDATLGSVEF